MPQLWILCQSLETMPQHWELHRLHIHIHFKYFNNQGGSQRESFSGFTETALQPVLPATWALTTGCSIFEEWEGKLDPWDSDLRSLIWVSNQGRPKRCNGERPSVALKNTTAKKSKRMRTVKTSCPFYGQAARIEILKDLGNLTPKCILWKIWRK